MNENAETEL